MDWNENQSPRFISGPVSDMEIKDTKDMEDYLLDNRDAYGLSLASFKVTSSENDTDLGGRHYRVQMTEEGIPVEGSELTVHTDKNNTIYYINGSLDKTVEYTLPSIKPSITSSEALSEVRKLLDLHEGLKKADVELCFYKKGSTWYKAYKVELASAVTPQHWLLYINAQDKGLLEKIDCISYYLQPDDNMLTQLKNIKQSTLNDDVFASYIKGVRGPVEIGTGKGYLGQDRTFGVKKSPTADKYLMIDESRPAEISTLGCINGSSTSMTITSPTLNFTDASAVDAQFYAAGVYDYYKNVHNRNSVDNKDYHLWSNVHYGTKLNNAFWTGFSMMYGDGDGVKFRPFTTDLNVIAHEITHGVTTNTANLVYKDQSGALNEAFSDIMSYFIEAYYTGDYTDWDVGEDLFIKGPSAVRNIKQPSLYGQPENMKDYITTTEDNGGVHFNSGIINKAFYNAASLLDNPKSMEKVYFKALTQILTSKATFIDSRNALVQAAEDLYGMNSMEAYAIAKGYSLVGIGSEIPKPTATPLPDTFSIKGFVSADLTYADDAAGKMLEGFIVNLSKGDVTYSIKTDSKGYFEAGGIKAGEYLVSFSKLNYLERLGSVKVDNDIILGSLDKPVQVVPGDMAVNDVQDRAINMIDIMEVVSFFNSVSGDGKYSEAVDLNLDGAINMSDIMVIVGVFNKTSSDYPELTIIRPTPTPTEVKSPTPTPTLKPTPTPFPQWLPDKAYAVGDRVSYMNSNYQCIQAHTSNDNWAPPDTLNILWKKV
ncbi:MAG: M4 family metallopeptidase [Clostridia bacterium]|nr:M4 family metallopeptidase [Clostridia bacterium]